MAAAAPVRAQGNENKVAFLGPLASYSHQATKSAFPGQEWELTPTVTIKDVFDVVQAGEAAYGVVPFENSTHGIVTFTLDSLADRAGSYAGISVYGEVYLDVHHFLLGRRQSAEGEGDSVTAEADMLRARPLTDLKHIQRVYSHPQAFGQTSAFFAAYLRGVDTIDVTSTSKAAEMAAADTSGTSAAVAGEMAGEEKGLDVLARCIEDREDNTTRFFLIRKDEAAQQQPEGGKGATAKMEDGGEPYGPKYKTLVSFTVPHRTPGALADVLDCFKQLRLNLTSINSLPSLLEPFHYLFFVEFEGSRLDDPEGRVKVALERLAETAQGWRWLGSWRNQRRVGESSYS